MPKSEGGLGVIQLEAHNEALLLKNLHKFYNKADTPWVHLIWEKYYTNGRLPNHSLKGSFWWKDILKLLDKYKGMAVVSIHQGDTCFLWQDPWNNIVPKHYFLELLSFAKNKFTTLSRAGEFEDLNQVLNRPISSEAYAQLLLLAQLLESLPNDNQEDIWTYIWGSPLFTTTKAYKQLIGFRIVHPGYKWLRKSSLQKKHKVFFLLLLKDRLSTQNILRRKNMDLPSCDCVLCHLTEEETVEHLFLNCPFAQSCWSLLHLFIPQGDPFAVLSSLKMQLHVKIRRLFLSFCRFSVLVWFCLFLLSDRRPVFDHPSVDH